MDNNIQALEKIYQCATNTAYGLQKISDKTENKKLYDTLNQQRLSTEQICHNIERELIQYGENPSQPGILAKLDLNSTLIAGTITDNSSSRLAELAINKLNKENQAINQTLNNYEPYHHKTKALADELLELNQNSIELLKSQL